MANGNGSTKELVVSSSIQRLNYFFGQLLTEGDLRAEQGYHVGLRRLMQREAFGTGTVTGLKVKASTTALDGVIIEAGLAMDPAGRELVLLDDTCIVIADVQKTVRTPAPIWTSAPDPAGIASDVSADWGVTLTATDVIALQRRLLLAGLTDVNGDSGSNYSHTKAQLIKVQRPTIVQLPEGQTAQDYFFEALIGTTHIALRYCDLSVEPSPSVLGAGCCDSGCKPARREQAVIIVTSPNAFPTVEDPYAEARLAVEGRDTNVFHTCPTPLYDFVLSPWREPVWDGPCIRTFPELQIATVTWARYPRDASTSPRILDIRQTCGERALALNGPTLRALIGANDPWRALTLGRDFYATTLNSVTIRLGDGVPIAGLEAKGLPLRVFVGKYGVVHPNGVISSISAITGLTPEKLRDQLKRLYIKVFEDSAGSFHAELFANAACEYEDRIGHTATYSGTGPQEVIPDNESGLGGSITVALAQTATAIVECVQWYLVGDIDRAGSDTVMLVRGPALPAEIGGIWVGSPSMVFVQELFVGGDFAAAESQHVYWDVAHRAYYCPSRPPARLVAYTAIEHSHEAGKDPRITLLLNDADASGDVVLTSENVWYAAPDLVASNLRLGLGSAIEIRNKTALGASGNHDLTVLATFVYE